MNTRIRKNNLLPWFTDDHRTLPEAYLRSCREFFDSLKAQAPRATSHKLNQKNLHKPGTRVKNRFNRKR